MARQNKKVSLDAAFKAVLRDQGVVTQKDMEKLQTRITRLENAVGKLSAAQKTAGQKTGPARTAGSRRNSATNAVLESIKKSKKSVGIEDIQKKTGFDKKKIRNIVFRLNKLGKIQKAGRGKYVRSEKEGT